MYICTDRASRQGTAEHGGVREGGGSRRADTCSFVPPRLRLHRHAGWGNELVSLVADGQDSRLQATIVGRTWGMLRPRVLARTGKLLLLYR
jgi:hypothetical protein